MFVGDSQMLRNKRHFVISVIAINVFYCNGFDLLNKSDIFRGCLTLNKYRIKHGP